jgi:hypothetical protein
VFVVVVVPHKKKVLIGSERKGRIDTEERPALLYIVPYPLCAHRNGIPHEKYSSEIVIVSTPRRLLFAQKKKPENLAALALLNEKLNVSQVCCLRYEIFYHYSEQ